MTDKLNPILPKLAPLLRMLGSGADAEVVKAVSAMRALLERVDADFHNIVDALEKSVGPTDEKIAQLYDAAETAARKRYWREYQEARRRCGIRPDGSTDWEAIAVFVQQRKNRLEPKHYDFVDSIAAQTSWYGQPGHRTEPSDKQKPWLIDLFRRLGGKIE
jgi:hypothetical protein